jgi:hypothetical protein
MRYIHQSIIAIGLLCSSLAYAVEFYADALYWQASETVDWSLTNNLSLPNQVIAYNTIDFDFAPGFRVGAGINKNDWYGRVLYTHYHVKENESVQGNVVSAFIPGKFAQGLYKSGQVDFKIDYNMVDIDLYKQIQVGESFLLRPIIGLKGGTINQQVNTQFQGGITVLERVSNDFTGFGPKAGIESRWVFYKANDIAYSLAADVSTALMWGKWSIKDNLTQSNSSLPSSLRVGKRNMGAFEVQGLVGVNVHYKNADLKIGYEAQDWFNQYQVFDDGTGTHANDLVLQGLTVALTWRC